MDHAQWGTAVVPVRKKNGEIRLCAAYNTTINNVIEEDCYPIPRVEDLLHKLNGGKYFYTLDVQNAYLHMAVDKKCAEIKFTLITDNQPLARIFHEGKDLPPTSAILLLHCANYISGFNYELKHRRSQLHANADYLSRAPILTNDRNKSVDSAKIFQIKQLATLPISHEEIKKETKKDHILRQIYCAVQGDSEFQLPYGKITDFSVQDGCLLTGIRVTIPKSLRRNILDELHSTHVGTSRMKALARSHMWWPRIDKDIEELAHACIQCAETRNDPIKVIVHPWENAVKRWQRVHVDYLGPLHGRYIFVLVDAYTKWNEAFPTKTITSTKTIEMLREIFARFGLPYTLVSDNGTNFKSREFKEFLKSNGIVHKVTAPYHPATNGQAERYVQSIKRTLRNQVREGTDFKLSLQRFLMQYRKTPHTITEVSPAELMFGRNIVTGLDLVRSKLKTEQKAERKTLEE
nr:uncharacterized protein K02A2.6-like [Onthophagus taurus]